MMISVDTIPKELTHLRACLLCGLVKNLNQFIHNGCNNCDEFLQMKGDQDSVYQCTSSNFSGTIAMMHPEDSWVAKWQHIKGIPGIYAIAVQGRLPGKVVHDLAASGFVYRPLDANIVKSKQV